jgi:ferredoxin--NADP+ reductase
VKLEDLQEFYDAVIFSTGAKADRDLGIPGEEHSIGAADFVSWYDAHPDDAPTWDFEGATSVAVLGVGNVALDVARVLAKTADEMLVTDIPAQVYEGLKTKQVTDVHVFARRGPAYAKFSPLELRELNHSPNVEVIVHPEGFDVDEHGMEHIGKHKSQKMVLDTLANWVGRDPVGKPHRIHLHFCESPVEIVAVDGKVTAFKTERTHSPNADGNVVGTGEITDWAVQQVYRAIGYKSAAAGPAVGRAQGGHPQRRRQGPRSRGQPHPRHVT